MTFIVIFGVAMLIGVACICYCFRCRSGRVGARRSRAPKVSRHQTKSRHDAAAAMEAGLPPAPRPASFRLPLGDSFGRTPVGRALSKKLSQLSTSLGLEVPESSQSIRMQDSAAELVLDGRDPPPPTWPAGSRGASGFLARAISSMLPVDHKAAAKALEEEEDDDDQRMSLAVFDDRPLEGLPPVAADTEASQEWWFQLDKHDNILGPYTPSQMRQLYQDGKLGHSTPVRWLPVAYAKPHAAEQPVDGFSPLQELCSDEGPPFMDASHRSQRTSAVESAPPAPAKPNVVEANVRSRVERARRSLATIKPPAAAPESDTPPEPRVARGRSDETGRDENSMRI